jgi:hypothetical protein
MMKPDGFISWEDHAVKSQEVNIVELEELLKEVRSH